jgi:lipopolysaccharide transport system permease protein
MSAATVNPARIASDLWRHRYLLGQLIKRDVLLRYRGAVFGVLWIFLSPLVMLATFAFVFGAVFHARWPQQSAGGLPFWLLLYSSLITFNIFAETVSRAPGSVRGYPSFVKKIIFPLPILPLVPLGAALVHAGFNLLMMMAALAWFGTLHWQLVLFPVLLLPLLLLALGIAWFVAAWGVYIKDMTQIVPLFVQMLMFLSPVFYPASAVPAALQPLIRFSPVAAVIESTRSVAAGQPVDWGSWGWAFAVGMTAVMLGYAFFLSNQEEFADAL